MHYTLRHGLEPAVAISPVYTGDNAYLYIGLGTSSRPNRLPTYIKGVGPFTL